MLEIVNVAVPFSSFLFSKDFVCTIDISQAIQFEELLLTYIINIFIF